MELTDQIDPDEHNLWYDFDQIPSLMPTLFLIVKPLQPNGVFTAEVSAALMSKKMSAVFFIVMAAICGVLILCAIG